MITTIGISMLVFAIVALSRICKKRVITTLLVCALAGLIAGFLYAPVKSYFTKDRTSQVVYKDVDGRVIAHKTPITISDDIRDITENGEFNLVGYGYDDHIDLTTSCVYIQEGIRGDPHSKLITEMRLVGIIDDS